MQETISIVEENNPRARTLYSDVFFPIYPLENAKGGKPYYFEDCYAIQVRISMRIFILNCWDSDLKISFSEVDSLVVRSYIAHWIFYRITRFNPIFSRSLIKKLEYSKSFESIYETVTTLPIQIRDAMFGDQFK